jgi:hypothetical protein
MLQKQGLQGKVQANNWNQPISSTPFAMSSTTARVVCLALGLLAGLARAQGDPPSTLPPMHGDGKESMASATVGDSHERRAALRAALLAQREAASRQDLAPTVEERQLNEKERAELRQQVRQQRRPLP